MNHLTKFLVSAFGLIALAGLTGCDVDEECDEAGLCDAGTEELDAEVLEETYNWLIIIDNSIEQNGAGTPGADICGIQVLCDGSSVGTSNARLSKGGGNLCQSSSQPDCSTNRGNPAAARDEGGACEANSTPSDYVSLGMGGTLSVQYTLDIRGCSAEIVELQGNDQEGYDVYVCSDGNATGDTCLNNDESLGGTANGGTISVNIPNE